MRVQVKNQFFGAWLLLLLYLFSIAPAFLFHQHDHGHHLHEIVAYEKANSCEKAVYFSDRSAACQDKTHIGKYDEKCGFCAEHTFVIAATIPAIFKYFLLKIDAKHALVYKVKSGIAAIALCAGRSPPSGLNDL